MISVDKERTGVTQIAGSFTFTNVSIYIVDLKRVRPFGPPSANGKSHLISSQVELNGSPDEGEPPDPGGGELDQANIQSQEDYRIIFRSNNNNKHEVSSKSVEIQTKAPPSQPFLPPLESPVKKQFVRPCEARLTNPVRPLEKCPSVDTRPTVSVVRPVAKPVIFPDLKPSAVLSDNTPDFVPDLRERPAGLDLEDFYPRELYVQPYLQESLKTGIPPHPELTEPEAMTAILRGHQPMLTVLNHRRKHLQIVLAQWAAKDVRVGRHRLVGRSDVRLSWHRIVGSFTRSHSPEASRHVFSSPQM
ncbi:KATNB1 [Cordylochernes scorpioides]|uniref:KATNB1 n=1 Tax=Cordylochernes scorpioides TaxID=51811 RepID=A0ABY6JVY0_9ARAC|nr:KATNB1 [Cordylochernes scorpioides]